jgi:hypothetical protein
MVDWLDLLDAVPPVFPDVPDGEDAPRIADAKLDVRFDTDPAPLVDPLFLGGGDVNSPGGIERLPGQLALLVDVVEDRASSQRWFRTFKGGTSPPFLISASSAS